MKLLTKTLLLFLFYLNLTPGQECTPVVSIRTDNPSAKIYLNNELAGTGSVKKELEIGRYIIRVVTDSLAWNKESFIDSFVVTNCRDNKNFNYTLNNLVYLQTDPPDSYVFNDDSLLGHTPLFISKNFNNLILSKPGYEKKVISINDNAGEIINLNYLGEESELPFIKRDIFKILVGSAVVLGGLTAYFKIKADDYFEDYEFTGSKDLLDKTKQYDVISGLTFGALQINFGVLIYYFLVDE